MNNQLASLSSNELQDRIVLLVKAEREVLADLLLHLAEMDRRRLYAEAGCSSLFAYCTEILEMASSSAQRRVVGARMLAMCPEIEGYLRDGRLNLSTVCALRKVIEDDREVPEWALGKSEEEIKWEVAAMYPLTAAPAVIRPISDEFTEIKITVSREFMELLADAKSALSHDIPNGNLEAVLIACMRTTIKKKQNASRMVPAAVRKVVRARAKGCCEFTAADGKRCASRHRLEYHHKIPAAHSGPSTVENIALMCRAHNLHHAIQDFGAAHMANFLGG
jgi:hypothetical protein